MELALFEGIPVGITSGKKLQRFPESPAPVYVITQDDIRKSGAIHLHDVLRQKNFKADASFEFNFCEIRS